MLPLALTRMSDRQPEAITMSINSASDHDGYDGLSAEARAEIRDRVNRPNIEFDDVIAAALANLDRLIDELIPASTRGKTKGDELWSCNPTRPDKTPESFSINKRTGKWHDFSGGDGGNIITLWKLVKGLTDNTDSIFAIAKFLHVPERDHKPEFRSKNTNEPGKIVAVYDYTDLNGTLLYQGVRYEPKDFRQRRPDGKGGWISNLDGVKGVIYRWPKIHKYPDASVFLCEGEKERIALHRPVTARQRLRATASGSMIASTRWPIATSSFLRIMT